MPDRREIPDSIRRQLARIDAQIRKMDELVPLRRVADQLERMERERRANRARVHDCPRSSRRFRFGRMAKKGQPDGCPFPSICSDFLAFAQ